MKCDLFIPVYECVNLPTVSEKKSDRSDSNAWNKKKKMFLVLFSASFY